ncbi:hypothetical protein JCM3765_006760 [Sporobolomyces pararoseus]
MVLSHPSLPPRPGSYQPPTSLNRPPPTSSSNPAPPIPQSTTPLSLPNRPNAPSSSNPTVLPSRPPLGSSTSSFFGGAASSPKLSASSASSQTGKEYAGAGSGGAGGDLAWPRVRGKFTPEEARVNSELIELGQGWSVKYKCWKGTALPLSPLPSEQPTPPIASTSNLAVPSSSNPTSTSSHSATTNPSPSKEQQQGPPPKKKSRPTLNPTDSFLAEELGNLNSPLTGPLSSLPSTPLPKFNQPTARTDASTSKLEDQLKTLRTSQVGIAEDPFERARRDLIRRGKQKVEEGGDKLDLMCFVRVTSVQFELNKKEAEEDGKGKGKEKEQEPNSETTQLEAAGRLLWAFSVIRGGDLETAKADLDELEYNGLECISSGVFDHQALYPSLYPSASSTSSTSNSNVAGISPLSRPAQSYPSALAISANVLSSATPRQSPLAVAHSTFLSAVEDLLISEAITTSPSSTGTWTKLDKSLVSLPPVSSFSSISDFIDSNASPNSPRKRAQPSSSSTTFRTTLQRSTIFVQTRIEELPYRPFPLSTSPSPPVGCPILLAPLGLRARLNRRIKLEGASYSDERIDQLTERWRIQLEGSNLEIQGKAWITCKLELGTTDDNESGKFSEEEGGGEVVWPTDLVIIDGTRLPLSESPESSPDKSPPTDLSLDAEPTQQPSHLPVTSPDSKFPPPPFTTPEISTSLPPNRSRTRPGPLSPSPYDISSRKRLATKALRRSRRKAMDAEEETKLLRDPLSRRTNEVWSWMEEEAARKTKEAEEKLAREQKEKEEEEERKKQEELDKKKSNTSKNPPPAAAPINMRTPMSLGTSSTEAPSPADVVYPLAGYSTSATTSQQNYLTTPTSNASGSSKVGGGDNMEIDGLGLGLYPSPEEPPHLNQQSVSTTTVTTSQPMTSLDNAFASFDWGDGSYGTTSGDAGGGGGRGGVTSRGNQDYDDGMDLLGLTDDDFSFFDTAPTPLPGTSLAPSNDMSMSISHDPFAMPHSTTTSPKFADHFSHLSATPFASCASPTSPYPAHTSPHFAVQTSPITTTASHFPFDPHSNSLGLAATSSNPVDRFLSHLHEPSPSGAPSPDQAVVSLAVPSFSVELVKAPSPRKVQHSSPRRSRCPLPGAFDAISFAASYSSAAEKYDSRKGKFGLPTPDSDQDDKLALDSNLTLDSILPRPTPKSLEPWYAGICDPRRAVAERLQKDRKAREKRARSTSRGRGRDRSRGPLRGRGWKRALSRSEERSDGTETADEESEHDSDMEIEEIENVKRRQNVDDQQESSNESRKLVEAGGVELLAFGGFVNSLVQRQTAAKPSPIPIPTSAIQAHEILLNLVVDQNILNSASRSLFTISQTDSLPRFLSTFATNNVSTALASVCSSLSPSPLFADHTLLPGLEVTVKPSLILRSQQSVVQVSTSAVEFWKPMGFEPVVGRKDVTVFAVYEEAGTVMHDLVANWLKSMATTYQGLRLGEHICGQLATSGQFGGTQDGHLALPAGSLTRGISKEDSRVLSTVTIEMLKQYHNVVVFVFTPQTEAESYSTSSPLHGILNLLQRPKSPISTLVACPVPMSQLNKSEPSQGRTSSNLLGTYAFSLYDQLLVPVARLGLPVPETFPSAAATPSPASQGQAIRMFQSPAIKLSPVRPRQISFDMNFPVSTLAVQQRHRFLHVCYTSSPASIDGSADWIHLASIDDTGENWRTINRLMKIPTGVPGDVMRARLVWQLILSLLQSIDVEWRIVICRLGEPSVVEIRAWDSMLKDQLNGSIRRPLHVSFVYVDLDPPLAILPSETKRRRSSVQSDTISEEGELSLVSRPASSAKSEPLFDMEPTILSFTPSEPVNVLPNVSLLAPASTYLINVPRIPTFTHTHFDASSSSLSSSGCPSPISIYGLHFLVSHASRTSSYIATLSDLVKDVRQSYAELGALARVRWSLSGRLPWHLEAVKLSVESAASLHPHTSD